MIVNALRTAGTEVISVNGQHIGLGTFVCTVGAAILINATPVSSPYEVTVIGNSNTLSVALVRDTTGGYLSTAQLVSGMTAGSEVSQSLSMEALAPSSSQYAQLLSIQPEGDTQ